ncbi:hypothetical protein BC831DRAFT_80756 [Entophlyctis helioformis]|nr:hypothetical protein BC831DRAFT_80756 [Entophlyctis helioformis]
MYQPEDGCCESTGRWHWHPHKASVPVPVLMPLGLVGCCSVHACLGGRRRSVEVGLGDGMWIGDVRHLHEPASCLLCPHPRCSRSSGSRSDNNSSNSSNSSDNKQSHHHNQHHDQHHMPISRYGARRQAASLGLKGELGREVEGREEAEERWQQCRCKLPCSAGLRGNRHHGPTLCRQMASVVTCRWCARCDGPAGQVCLNRQCVPAGASLLLLLLLLAG